MMGGALSCHLEHRGDSDWGQVAPSPLALVTWEKVGVVSMSERKEQVTKEDSSNKHLQIALLCLGSPDSKTESSMGLSRIGSE